MATAIVENLTTTQQTVSVEVSFLASPCICQWKATAANVPQEYDWLACLKISPSQIWEGKDESSDNIRFTEIVIKLQHVALGVMINPARSHMHELALPIDCNVMKLTLIWPKSSALVNEWYVASKGMTARLTWRPHHYIDKIKPKNFLTARKGSCRSCKAGRLTVNATKKNGSSTK